MSALDRISGRFARGLARHTSRRTLIARLGTLLAGTAALPLLPVARARAEVMPSGKDVAPTTTGNPQDPGNPRACDYWRYCALDGFLCSCCGGTQSACPPGSVMSPVTWNGTCLNPADEQHYIISYNDCCGKTACNRCFCNRNEREMPVYRAARANDIQWCMGLDSAEYTCSVALILGTAKSAS
jgi:methylamine dehydrogenase light chain